MTNDAQGDIGRVICFQDAASKGKSGRVIPISEELRTALTEYRKTVPHAGLYVISTERALATSPQAIVNCFSGGTDTSGSRVAQVTAAGTLL
jgi:integrase/recombinase XerD